MKRKFESIDIWVLSCFDDCICQKIAYRISMKFVKQWKIVFYIFFFLHAMDRNFGKILLDIIFKRNEIIVKFI